ncbi:P-loop containing nucleoside triphosphate hydrolase protein [Cantharellus anzutake]|uniref:P-loop containing nucleoside triphosphate hydrolase protein n=1 Tax=Cantharellus anzutake TaxID=1750568 RepID=UPI0019082267|nr:P-loop containing nucleoside triphosphate hydrolase protein [Cantharellus anzutake]KAF8333191.1 P-loop containing nucleoside triphosphate hydrolase protein [Cantharellus anzutake]
MKNKETHSDPLSTPTVVHTKPTQRSPPAPTYALLFSHCSRNDVFTLLIPAVIASLVGGGVQPFMTHLIGQAFNAMAQFPNVSPTDGDRHRLVRTMTLVAIELVCLAAGSLIISSLISGLWLRVGERIVMRVRNKVFHAVVRRDIEWFDKLGVSESENTSDGIGAGGLMAKFARETEDVREAVSLTFGLTIQNAASALAALILAFKQSWSLSLVILSVIPITIVIQGASQTLSAPHYDAERSVTASVATRITRAIASISTVKSYNAAGYEESQVSSLLEQSIKAYKACTTVWGASNGAVQFVLFSMFVQGFWFGAKLVREGKASAGTVMSVFWACIVLQASLGTCLPLLVTLTKGKTAMASLQVVINGDDDQDAANVHDYDDGTVPPPYMEEFEVPSNYPQPIPASEGLRPTRCLGTFDIHDLTFTYASRPGKPALSLATSPIPSIHIAGNDITFIVGSSGSGKSTIASILAGLYRPASGVVMFDEVEMGRLDQQWVHERVGLVGQECVLFEGSIMANVAIGVAGSGKRPEDVPAADIEKACRIALMHDFILSLPRGYSTPLGPSGLALSGGQRQRLALARAILRDPAVLILDEATSALDATTRLLVFEAVRQERKRRTTVVVTHDLSMLRPSDYVYVMKDGRCVEEGFREDLVGVTGCPCGGGNYIGPRQKGCKGEWDDVGGCGRGEFRAMLERQMGMGGSLPPVELVDQTHESVAAVERAMSPAHMPAASTTDKRVSKRASIWTKSVIAPWEVDAIRDIVGSGSNTARAMAMPHPKNHLSPYKLRGRYESVAPPSAYKGVKGVDEATNTHHRPSSMASAFVVGGAHGKSASVTSLPSPAADDLSFPRPKALDLVRRSMTFEPVGWAPDSPVMVSFRQRRDSAFERTSMEDEEEKSFEGFKEAMEKSGLQAVSGRRHAPQVIDVIVPHAAEDPTPEQLPSVFVLTASFWSTIPDKFSTILGLIFALINGALTPIFSFLLARLLAQIGLGNEADAKTTNLYGLLVLIAALTYGAANGLQFYLLEMSAMRWIAYLRLRALSALLKQDKAYFDEEKNSPERLVSILVTDGDDARTLIASVAGPFVVVIVMLTVGLLWAMVRGWQLTLVGLAIVPVFGGAMILQSHISTQYEARNKIARDEVARRYYEAVASIRAIRAMALENVFERYFENSVNGAMEAGVEGSFVAGLGFGVAQALIYLAEALLFYVGAVFMSRGTYSYLKLVQVLNLVVFSVAIASQMLTFVPKIAKAKQAAIDLGKVLSLGTQTTESRGSQRFPIEGEIAFHDVYFNYPQRPDVPILRGLSGVIQRDECVAVVGASGSGKSTTAALLQRLYEPDAGRITIGGFNIADTNVKWLRQHVAIVSQTAQLFDATIAENIAYGWDSENIPFELVERAARDAHIHDFIMSLPSGYDTVIGENASLISGGQAQRLSIARALFNGRANVMIFDECTSALDPANSEAVMNTIMEIKKGRTCILITHKDSVMKRCDRILVLDGGLIVEEGPYEALMKRRGRFFQLASAGERADVE